MGNGYDYGEGIPQIFPELEQGFVLIEDVYGNTATIANEELRDLGRCLIALADEAGE